MKNRVYVGFDERMPLAYDVCVSSIEATSKTKQDINPLKIQSLVEDAFYYRPTIEQEGVLFDVISDAPMSTEFAISRFLVPFLSGFNGWSIFCDSDFMFRDDIDKVFSLCDDKYAVMCVKHFYEPDDRDKMNGQKQTSYFRKNWSSLMLFNNSHPKNAFLNVRNVNSLAGRDLHRFCWLEDDDIGSIPESWNWLEGHSSLMIEPQAVHFTRGTPDMQGYDNVDYGDEWKKIASSL